MNFKIERVSNASEQSKGWLYIRVSSLMSQLVRRMSCFKS